MTSYVLTYRSQQQTALTEAQFDGNTHNLDDRITVLEGLPAGVGVDSVTISGYQLSFHLSDSSVETVTLPTPTFAPIPGDEVDTTTYTTVAEDAGRYLRFTNAAGCVITIDPEIVYPAWTEMHFRDATGQSSGGISVTTSTPAAINDVNGFENATLTDGGTITIKQVNDTGAWDIMGLLLPTSA